MLLFTLQTSNKQIFVAYLSLNLRFESRHEKTCLRGFRPGPTQTGLHSCTADLRLCFHMQNAVFLMMQLIYFQTNGATDFEFFTIEDEAYLAVANAYNYGPQNYRDRDTFRTNSTIYRLNIGKKAFQKWQTFQTNR